MTNKRKNKGPPLQLTEKIIDDACKIVGRGCFRYVAAQHLGIVYATWCSWIRRGTLEVEDYAQGKRDDLGLQGQLVMRLSEAEAKCHSAGIRGVLNGPPELIFKFLKTRYGKLYSNNPNAVIDDETGQQVQKTAASIIAEKLAMFIEEEDKE